MSKSSRFPAMAGTVAGLLAAAAGAWFLYPQQLERGRQPVIAPAAAQASAQPLGREQAEARLMALPELRAWAQRIEQASGGKVHGAIVVFDPALREVDGKRYHQLHFVENRPEAAVTWESFLVGEDGDILVDDTDDGSTLTLQRWRSERHPLDRAVAGSGRP